MWMWLDRAGLILFDATISTALFLSLVVCALLFCRQPSRRLLIVRASLLGSLAIIPVVAMVPLPRVDVLDLIVEWNLLPPSFRAIDSNSHRGPHLAETGNGDRLNTTWTHFKHDYLAWAGRWLPRCLTLIVVIVAFTGALWVLLGFWGVQWLLRHSQEPSVSIQAVYDTISTSWAQKRPRPDVRVSAAVMQPVLVGMRRTTILIPASYEAPEASAEICKLSLLHEFAHAAQSDAWFSAIASLAQSVWFFLPHVSWLRSQLMIDQEFIADHAASQGYGTPKEYAASLLSLADSRANSAAKTPPRRHDSIVTNADERRAPSPLFLRMRMLLHCPFPVERTLPRRWSWSLKCIVLVASFASACVCIRWPHAHAIEERSGSAAGREQAIFRVDEFVAAPIVHTSSAHGLPHHLPVELSSRFDLRVDVLASPIEMAKIRVAGHPLTTDASTRQPVDSCANPSLFAQSWHSVRLLREGTKLSLWIDGEMSSTNLDADATTEWLMFEPGPDRFICFRNLLVQW